MFQKKTLLIIFLTASLFLSYIFFSRPVEKNSTQKVEFIVEPGESLDEIVYKLQEKKLVRSSVFAKINIILRGVSKKIQAGYFYFSPSQDLSEITDGLTHSSSKQIWVTIPEGLRREEIADLISKEFSDWETESYFSPQDFVYLTKEMEGHLFPDTYAFNIGVTTEEVIDKLNQEFQDKAESIGFPIENQDLIILASILERESQKEDEMPIIAGILKKRLNSSWPLQIDATVQYALSSEECTQLNCNWWPSNLNSDNLQIDSPYNTYKNQGLPPTPICNPGLQSMKAVINPQESDYWFYLHGLDQEVHFAETLQEHQKNVCLYLNKDC